MKSYYGEHVWCSIGDMLVGVCYRSQNASVVGHNNDSELCSVLKEVSNEQVIIMGDFNYPDVDWLAGTACNTHDSNTLDFVNSLENCFYTQHVHSPTRDGSILDLVLTRDPDIVSNVCVLHNLGCSDHNMVSFSLHYGPAQRSIDNRNMRDFKRGNYDKARQVLAEVDCIVYSWAQLQNAGISLKTY